MLSNRIFILIYFTFILSSIGYAQDIKFSSGGPLYKPSIASFTESRTGLIKDINSSKIRLDIGISPDIFSMEFKTGGSKTEKLSLGADFHAFGLLFNESAEIILQVGAIDAFFGGHISYKTELMNNDLALRLRIMHLSSHLVDGHYSIQNSMWKNNKLPMSFGREFVELSGCYSLAEFRFNIGMNYIFRQRPDVLGDMNYEAALDYLSESFPSRGINYFFSYSFKLNGIDASYSGSNCLMTGVRIGKTKGLDLFLVYYTGKNYYGEYYNEGLEYIGTGFNIFVF